MERWILLSQPDHTAVGLLFEDDNLKAKDWRFGSDWEHLLAQLPDLSQVPVEVRAYRYVRFTLDASKPCN